MCEGSPLLWEIRLWCTQYRLSARITYWSWYTCAYFDVHTLLTCYSILIPRRNIFVDSFAYCWSSPIWLGVMHFGHIYGDTCAYNVKKERVQLNVSYFSWFFNILFSGFACWWTCLNYYLCCRGDSTIN